MNPSSEHHQPTLRGAVQGGGRQYEEGDTHVFSNSVPTASETVA